MEALRGALLLVLLLVTVVFAVYKYQELYDKNPNEKFALPASVVIAFAEDDGGRTLHYKGQTGYTVLDLLKQAAEVQTFNSNPDWIYSINGRNVAPGKYWIFSINDEPQAEPPGQTQTHENQNITWQFVGPEETFLDRLAN